MGGAKATDRRFHGNGKSWSAEFSNYSALQTAATRKLSLIEVTFESRPSDFSAPGIERQSRRIAGTYHYLHFFLKLVK